MMRAGGDVKLKCLGGLRICGRSGWWLNRRMAAFRQSPAAHCHAMVEDCLRHGETERITQRVHDTAMRFYAGLLA